MLKVPEKALKIYRIFWGALFLSVVLLTGLSFLINPIPVLLESTALPEWTNTVELVLATVAIVNFLLVGSGAVDKFSRSVIPKQAIKMQESPEQSLFLHFNKMILAMAILESAVLLGFVIAQMSGSAWKVLPFTFVYLIFAPRYYPRSEIPL
ncbi:hypothetical protein GW915_12805 [bacterium]|nr:hypothetical protein [bacterium]